MIGRNSTQLSHIQAHATSFVGRHKELADIAALLQDPACRILTLTGAGGIGKTRLALEASAQRAPAFEHGIAVVALQAVGSPELIVPAIANAIGCRLPGQADRRTLLLDCLRDKRLLLVIDNVEHLLDGVDVLSDIVQAAPAVKLLTTSREVLGLHEEWIYRVGSLSVPIDDQAGDVTKYSAVALFLARARQQRPDFSLSDEQRGVLRLCRLVAGIPLAIELAASWINTLSCDVIADEIERNLAILATPVRNVPERHRSMRAALEWSWVLLSAEERTGFARLSVFRGGFGYGAVQQVTGASPHTLAALVNKSLLQRESTGRYHMHELLRQFAAEKLTAEETIRLRDCHCAYYAGFLAARNAAMNGGRQREATIEIAEEFENIRAMWDWAVERADAVSIQQAASSLYLFFQFQSRYTEGADAFERAVRSLERREATPDVCIVIAEVLVYLGWLALRLGRLEDAQARLERSCDLYKSRAAPPPSRGMTTDPLIPLGVLAINRGAYSEAITLGEAALRLSEARGDQCSRMLAFYVLASAALTEGRYSEAQRHAHQAYVIASDQMPNQWFLAYCLIELGNVASALGDYGTATRQYRKSYAIREAFGDPEGMAVALNHLGRVALLQDKYEDARRLYQHSVATYHEIGDRGGLVAALNGLGRAVCYAGDHLAAWDHLSSAFKLAESQALVPLMLTTLVSLGELLLAIGQEERGFELLVAVMHHPASTQQAREQLEQVMAGYRGRMSPTQREQALRRGADRDLRETIAALRLDARLPDDMDAAGAAVALPDPTQQALAEPLTAREIEVLRLVARGWSNRDIAEELVIGLGTVKAHVHNICGKLGARNRGQAAARARELHVV